MGYTLGMPSLKLSNTAGKGGKHCGNFKKVTEEALKERLGQDLDINHDLTQNNEYLTQIKTAADLQNISTTWINTYNKRIEEENIQIEEEIKKAVKEYNDNHDEKLTKIKALKAINDERRANKQEPLQTKRRIRDDAVVMCATIIKPSAEFMSTLTPENQRQMLIDSYEKLKEIVGESNMKAAVIHYDELVPHLHTFWMPETEDGRLCAKEKHGLKFLGTLNKEMPAYLRSKGWDIDDCNAYDAEEEQRKKEEMGTEAYKKEKQEKRNNRGRSSSKFKYEVQKEVDDLKNSYNDLLEKACEVETDVSIMTEKQIKLTSELNNLSIAVEQKKEELYQQVLAIDIGNSYPEKISEPNFPCPDKDKSAWVKTQLNLNPDLNLFERSLKKKELNEEWETKTNEYRMYEEAKKEREKKEESWRKDYNNTAAIQSARLKFEMNQKESEDKIIRAKEEAQKIISNAKQEAITLTKNVQKRENEVEKRENTQIKKEEDFEIYKKTELENIKKNKLSLLKFKAKMDAEIQKKVNIFLQSKRHFSENENFTERIKSIFSHNKIEHEQQAKNRIHEIEREIESRGMCR